MKITIRDGQGNEIGRRAFATDDEYPAQDARIELSFEQAEELARWMAVNVFGVELRFPASEPHEIECSTCLGYGQIGERGPSNDKRDRKCLDCSGRGTVPSRR